MDLQDLSLDIQNLAKGYREGRFTPEVVLREVQQRIEQAPQRHVWITRLDWWQIQAYLEILPPEPNETLPLYGIPFAIKDNIDLAGIPTTAGCPDYAYVPEHHAFVVQQLIQAGAIPVGKTNLDQFATGLVGTRSPYGACRNSFDNEYISGGSSAGSAVAVATGLVSFALGTDTAGSGRVPAAFNHIVGIKPTRGLLSTRGVVPACRSLDCVSIFALSSDDASRVLTSCDTFDREDPYAREQPAVTAGFDAKRFRFGVPRTEQLEFFGNDQAKTLFTKAVEHLSELGGTPEALDFTPFLAAARLLYEGPWVSERYAAIEPFLQDRADALFPVTRDIILPGAEPSAVAAFNAQYRLMDYRRQSEAAWEQVDVILTPTAGTLYRIDQVEVDPIRLNNNLGYYTNFMNLLDLSAIAVPAGFQTDGLPFGVTLFAPAFNDASLAWLGDRLHRALTDRAGATGLPLPPAADPKKASTDSLPIAVCGAHLSSLPLNHQLTERGARLLQSTRTADSYRLFALPGGPPPRPGLVRSDEGESIEVEVWSLPLDRVGDFLAGIPAPLGLGRVELANGAWVCGFICQPYGIEGAEEVTRYGGWRNYLASRDSPT
ncbi:MAG: allophanate hydrolase [Gammaproteobacteria bacterium]|nr:allophanate hydrolase [Gammaproteobacteria bacterium]